MRLGTTSLSDHFVVQGIKLVELAHAFRIASTSRRRGRSVEFPTSIHSSDKLLWKHRRDLHLLLQRLVRADVVLRIEGGTLLGQQLGAEFEVALPLRVRSAVVPSELLRLLVRLLLSQIPPSLLFPAGG